MDGAWDTFGKKSLNGTFTVHQKILNGPKKFQIPCMQELNSAILAIFQRGPGWPCPVSTALKNPLLDLKKSFWV